MRVPTIVYPKHREEALLKQIQPLPTMLRAKLQAVALPTPPDYVIEWLPFQGGLEDAEKFTEGYDSPLPTQHLIESTKALVDKPLPPLTSAQKRQINLLEVLSRKFDRPLKVIDFGGCRRQLPYPSQEPKDSNRNMGCYRDPESGRSCQASICR